MEHQRAIVGSEFAQQFISGFGRTDSLWQTAVGNCHKFTLLSLKKNAGGHLTSRI
jgi:hypothetical protein